MKKLDFGQAISVLANLGVIAGIIFLAIEIEQNNQLLRAEAIGTVLDTRMIRQELQLSNPSLVSVVAKNRRGEPLTDEERITIGSLHARSLMGWQKDYFLFQEGILDEQYFLANLPLMKRAFARTDETFGYIDHWEANWREVASPDYRAFMEQCVIGDCEMIPR